MTDARWTEERPSKAGVYWYRDRRSEEIVQIVQHGATLRAAFLGATCSLDKLHGEWLGPIAPTDRAQGRVEGLREAADFVVTQELIDPSGHSSREQLKIYDVLTKASDGIRKLAQQVQDGKGVGDANG